MNAYYSVHRSNEKHCMSIYVINNCCQFICMYGHCVPLGNLVEHLKIRYRLIDWWFDWLLSIYIHTSHTYIHKQLMHIFIVYENNTSKWGTFTWLLDYYYLLIGTTHIENQGSKIFCVSVLFVLLNLIIWLNCSSALHCVLF